MQGVPLRVHDNIQERFRAVYDPAYFYQLMRGDNRLLEVPRDDAEREAVAVAWKRFVFHNVDAYLHYRWDYVRLLLALDHPPQYSNVYVWFTVIAAPETIPELQHDTSSTRRSGSA